MCQWGRAQRMAKANALRALKKKAQHYLLVLEYINDDIIETAT